MTDLFEAASRATRPAPPLSLLDRLKPNGRYVADRSSSHFVHDCARCGGVVAPFGFRASLIAALRSGDASRAGVWLCLGCRDLVEGGEGEQ